MKEYMRFPVAIDLKTRDDLQTFLTLSQRGDRAIYHLGYLAIDMAKMPVLRDLDMAIKEALVDGRVELSQRRIDQFMYEYRVVKL